MCRAKVTDFGSGRLLEKHKEKTKKKSRRRERREGAGADGASSDRNNEITHHLLSDVTGPLLTKKGVGSLLWMSPELLSNNAVYGRATDVYSFAIVMYELRTTQLPFPDLCEWDIPPAVMRGERPHLEPSDDAVDFDAIMCRAWRHEPHERPT